MYKRIWKEELWPSDHVQEDMDGGVQYHVWTIGR